MLSANQTAGIVGLVYHDNFFSFILIYFFFVEGESVIVEGESAIYDNVMPPMQYAMAFAESCRWKGGKVLWWKGGHVGRFRLFQGDNHLCGKCLLKTSP